MPGSQICRVVICLRLWKSRSCNLHIPWGWSCNNCVEMKILTLTLAILFEQNKKDWQVGQTWSSQGLPQNRGGVKKWVDWLATVIGSGAVAQNITSSCSLLHQMMGSEPSCSQAKLSYYRSTPFAQLAQRRHPVQTLLPTQAPPTNPPPRVWLKRRAWVPPITTSLDFQLHIMHRLWCPHDHA